MIEKEKSEGKELETYSQKIMKKHWKWIKNYRKKQNDKKKRFSKFK